MQIMPHFNTHIHPWQDMKGLVRSSFHGALEETKTRVKASVPGLSLMEGYFNSFFKHKKLGPKNASNTVDAHEMHKSFSSIKKNMGATYNPIFLGINLIRAILGSSKKERAQEGIKEISEYANQYHAETFSNDALSFLVKQLQKRVSEVQGWGSKLGFYSNEKKVGADPEVQALKQAIQAWTKPFYNLLHGKTQYKGGFTKGDERLLRDIADSLNANPYTRSSAAPIEAILKDYNQVLTKDSRKNIHRRPHSPAENMHHAA